ncbi:MAG: FkbM family methyltransferase [Pseudomonadota bacterium]
MGRYAFADVYRFATSLIACGRMMVNPIHAYGYLRAGMMPEMGEFSLKGLQFKGRKEDWVAIREVLVEDEYACVREILDRNASPRVLDLGANIGSFALRVFMQCPGAKVASVEAAEDTFQILESNKEANPNVDWQIFKNGVWKEDVPLNLMRRGISVGHRVVEGDGGEVVEGISLQTLLLRLGWEQVDLIKMDIEGGEEAIVPMAIDVLSRARYLIIEVHNDRIDEEPVMRALKSAFSRIRQLNDRRSNKPLYILSHDSATV